MFGLLAHQSRQRAATAVFVVIVLVVLLGFAALTVDIGQIVVVKARLQNAADAAALAGVSQTPDQEAIRSVAHQYAALNSPDQGAVLVDADIRIGRWDVESGVLIEGGEPANAVQIAVRRSEANGNPLELSFAPILGVAQSDVAASAVAVRPPPKTADTVPSALPVPGFGPVDPKIADHNPGKSGPSEPANGSFFEVGEEVTLFCFGKGPRQAVHLVLEPAESSGVSEIDEALNGDILGGDHDPVSVSVDDELFVWGTGTGNGNFGQKLVDRLQDGVPDNDTVIVPIIATLPGSRNDKGELDGKVKVVDFAAVTLTAVREVEVADPTDPAKTMLIEILVATVVEVSSGSENGLGTTAGTFTAGSVTLPPVLVR